MTTDTLVEIISLKKGRPYCFDDPVLYTTGAHIQPLKVVDRRGKETWFWVISEFIDDTFLDGDVFNRVHAKVVRSREVKESVWKPILASGR